MSALSGLIQQSTPVQSVGGRVEPFLDPSLTHSSKSAVSQENLQPVSLSPPAPKADPHPRYDIQAAILKGVLLANSLVKATSEICTFSFVKLELTNLEAEMFREHLLKVETVETSEKIPLFYSDLGVGEDAGRKFVALVLLNCIVMSFFPLIKKISSGTKSESAEKKNMLLPQTKNWNVARGAVGETLPAV